MVELLQRKSHALVIRIRADLKYRLTKFGLKKARRKIARSFSTPLFILKVRSVVNRILRCAINRADHGGFWD